MDKFADMFINVYCGDPHVHSRRRDDFSDVSTIYATLCCGLIGVDCMRPSWIGPPKSLCAP
jgi:hypothetical protein